MNALESLQASVDSLAKTAAASNAKVDLLVTAFGAVSTTLSGLAGTGGATPDQLNDLRSSIESTIGSLAAEADKVTAALATSTGSDAPEPGTGDTPAADGASDASTGSTTTAGDAAAV